MSHCHDHFVEEFSRALDDIKVAICHWIKTAGVNRAPHEGGNVQRPQASRASRREIANVLLVVLLVLDQANLVPDRGADCARTQQAKNQSRLPKFSESRRVTRSRKMNEPPYKKIAVASAFSPRFEQVLAEAKRVRDRLGSELSLIYVGKKNAHTTTRFAEALAGMGLPSDSIIHYHQGSPADAILEAVRQNEVELIVAGALEKEVVLRPFLGNVARRLVREAKCSVFLFTKPDREPKPLLRLVFFVPDYSAHARHAFQLTLFLAEKEGCENLYVIRVYTSFDAARATLRANLPDDTRQLAAPHSRRGRKGAGRFHRRSRTDPNRDRSALHSREHGLRGFGFCPSGQS